MKVSLTVLTVVAAGLLIFATSCHQSNTGESKSDWQLRSPGTAAGYGAAPLNADDRKDASPESPAAEKGQQEKAPAMNEPGPQQPAAENHKPASSTPTVKIVPPPPAAGYGRPPLETNAEKDALPPPAAENEQREAPPAANEPEPQKPAEDKGSGSSAPTWKIVPPPSAAGYGK